MLSKRNIIFLICLAVVGIVVIIGARSVTHKVSQKASTLPHQHKILHINDTMIAAEIADTDVLREQGLSGRASMASNAGMLFIFDTPDRYSFWMKDMNFRLDFLWISADNEIVDLTENVAPESYPKAFRPDVPVVKVLELNGGFAVMHGIKRGDIVSGL